MHTISGQQLSHYGLDDEELDFVVNYDIKYRMGRGADDGEAPA
jgi:hypothetical protein